ncbi:MAG: O-antigen ligase family protein, partial [Microcystaceae cyanobacterium]
DLAAAQTDINQYGTAVSKALLAIGLGKQPDLNSLPSFTNRIITAWQQPKERSLLFQQAWIEANQSILPTELEQQLLLSMQEAKDFKQWLTQMSPVLQYRRERLGFGVVSRHIDGVNPRDFFLVVENLPMTTWFSDLLPSPVYDPELDKLLQPEREKLF